MEKLIGDLLPAPIQPDGSRKISSNLILEDNASSLAFDTSLSYGPGTHVSIETGMGRLRFYFYDPNNSVLEVLSIYNDHVGLSYAKLNEYLTLTQYKQFLASQPTGAVRKDYLDDYVKDYSQAAETITYANLVSEFTNTGKLRQKWFKVTDRPALNAQPQSDVVFYVTEPTVPVGIGGETVANVRQAGFYYPVTDRFETFGSGSGSTPVNYVTTNTVQDITALKNFKAGLDSDSVKIKGGLVLNYNPTTSGLMPTGSNEFGNELAASAFLSSGSYFWNTSTGTIRMKLDTNSNLTLLGSLFADVDVSQFSDVPPAYNTLRKLAVAFGSIMSGANGAVDTFIEAYNRFLATESAQAALMALLATKANLSGGNAFSGTQTVPDPAGDYEIVNRRYLESYVATHVADGIDLFNVSAALRTAVVQGQYDANHQLITVLSSTLLNECKPGNWFAYKTRFYIYMPGDNGQLVWHRWSKLSGSGSGGDYTFQQDLTVSLSGAKTAGKYLSGQTIPLVGKTPEEAFRDIFIEDIFPTYDTASTSITQSAPTNGELGELITNVIQISFNQGDAGSVISIRSSEPGHTASSSPLSYSSQYSRTADVHVVQGYATYGAGVKKLITPGNKPDTRTPQVRNPNAPQAAETDLVSGTVQTVGYPRLFFGPLSDYPSDRSTALLLGSSALICDGNTFTLNTGTVNSRFMILLPPGHTLTSVVDIDNANTNITSSYVAQAAMSIADAGGNAITGYTPYLLLAAVPYNVSVRHQFTFN